MSFSQHGDSIVKLLDGFWDTAAFQFDIIRRPCVFIQQQKVTSLRAGTGWKNLSIHLVLFNITGIHIVSNMRTVFVFGYIIGVFFCTVRLGICKQ